MPIKTEDGAPFHDHNLLTLSNINHSNQLGTSIKGMESITADTAEFKDIKIDGNLEIDGKIHADKIEMSETQIILNIDYDKITEYMSNMDSPDLEFFIRHLHKLKLMAEKELLDRS
jgi:hypothetical protein